MSVVDKGGEEQLNIETIKWGKITWLNIEKPTPKDVEYLARNYPFHPLELEDCRSWIELPKMDEHENYLFLVLHFPVFNKEARVTMSSQVSVFIGEDFMVTVHSGDLKPLAKLFDDCQQNERAREENMGRSSGYLLYRVLDRLVDYCFPILNKVIANVEEVEDRLFSDQVRDVVQDISILRRDIMAFRRIIHPQPAILKSLEEEDYPFLREDLDVYFGDIGDHIGKITETLDEYREVLEGINASSDSLFTHSFSDVMKMLTILGTFLLPLLVVSSLFGMNVSLPFQDSSLAFLFIILMTLGLSGAMLAFFRFKRWI
ncbi:MAG: magnesium transporter CorA family protein [Dehalococcoidia bacterium]|nr:magnesium transporter CorA family protein [Dehalococcoidia bacterium]